jgi:hypothetical protein
VRFPGTFFWNVLQAPISGILFHPGFQNLLILVNSSGDLDISWNPRAQAHPVLWGIFKLLSVLACNLFKLLPRAGHPGTGFQSAGCPEGGLGWLLGH